MNIEIQFHELNGLGRLHQEGFKIEADGETYLEYCTDAINGLPYIKIRKGPHTGKTFAATPSLFCAALIKTFFPDEEITIQPA